MEYSMNAAVFPCLGFIYSVFVPQPLSNLSLLFFPGLRLFFPPQFPADKRTVCTSAGVLGIIAVDNAGS